MKPEEPPTLVIKAPPNYERNHELAECPFCNSPNPDLAMHMQVREFGYFDISLYVCNTVCRDCDKLHKFSAKHELVKDAGHLKIYDRTHVKDVW